MGTLFATVGMLVFPVLSVFFVWYPRSISNASWYGHTTERLYLYVFPPAFMFFGVACATEAFDRFDAPWPFWLEAVTLVPAVILTIVGFFGLIIPYPGFVTPKWVRDRRRKDKAARRRRRAERREEREAARAEGAG